MEISVSDIPRSLPRRSPRFPFINLEAAVERARQLHSHQKTSSSEREISLQGVVAAWHPMKEFSSALSQTVAALHQFGLLDDYWRRDRRPVSLSDLAVAIITGPDPTSSEYAAALRTAALTPKIFAELWQQVQQTGRADRSSLVRFLTTERDGRGKAPFTPKGAHDAVRLFYESVRYAGLMIDQPGEGTPLRWSGTGDAKSGDATQPIGDIKSFIGLTDFSDFAEGHLKVQSPNVAERGDWKEEALTDEEGELILICYRGKPTLKRYEFIRDVLDLKIKRLESRCDG